MKARPPQTGHRRIDQIRTFPTQASPPRTFPTQASPPRTFPTQASPPRTVPAAGQPAGAAAGSGPDGGPSPEPPRLYPAGDPEGPYAPPPFYGADPSQGGPYPGGQMPGRQGQNFFDWIRSQGIYRGRDRWIGGVASGIAHRLGVDPLIIRGVLIVLTIFAGLGVLAYGLAWALLPEPDGRIHVQEAAAGRWTAGMTGALITTVIGFPSLGTGVWGWDRFGFGAFVWTVFWVGGAIYVVYYLTQRNKTRNGATPMSARYDSSSPAGAATFTGTAGAEQHSAGGFPPAGVPAYGQPVNDGSLSDAGISGAGPAGVRLLRRAPLRPAPFPPAATARGRGPLRLRPPRAALARAHRPSQLLSVPPSWWAEGSRPSTPPT